MAGKSPDIRSQTKKVIFNVYSYLKDLVDNRPDAKISEVFGDTQVATAAACQKSLRTVQRITSEARNQEFLDIRDNCGGPLFKSPQKKVPHKNWKTDFDDFDLDVLRRTVLEFYDRGEYPTCKKVNQALQERLNFSGGVISTWKLLKKAGFKFKKSNDGRHFLMERRDIVASRVLFLRKMHVIRQDHIKRPIVYLDETWVNQNHSKKYIWQQSTNKGGFRVPVGKGSRLIICHAGSSEIGFIDGAQLLFQSKSKVDYHQEMNYEVFKEWFINLLRSLEESCVIVMDNASYHSKLKSNIPNTKTKKADIVTWLADKKIPHNPSHTVAELLAIVDAHKHEYSRQYELDDIALQMGHEVVRLPPYHCQYNPIELIWAQVKGEVAQKNTTFKIKDVRVLLENALKNVTIEDWAKCVQHSERLQEEDFEKECLRDENLQRIVINLQDDSDSDSPNSVIVSSDEEDGLFALIMF